MKLRNKYAWLLAAPLACLSGCSSGPTSGLAQKERVISLEHPDPLQALERSTQLQASTSEPGSIIEARWLRGAADPEEDRIVQLAMSRRRASRQMTMEMLMPSLAAPMHQSAAPPSAARTSPLSPAAPGRPAAAPAVAAAPAFTMPALPPFAAANRRMSRRQRNEAKADRTAVRPTKEETAATTEANRIERTAAMEAERAEKAALSEAQLAERRLLAEAELVERMTRAELELAERLTAAREERDRRIEMAKQERELRMAILGIDANELGSDPVNDAMARLRRPTPENSDSSALARFTKFFRTKTAEADAQQAQVAKATPPAAPKGKATNADDDLIARTLRDSESLIDNRSIANAAAAIPAPNATAAPTNNNTAAAAFPSDAGSGAGAGRRTAPENLHPSLLADTGRSGSAQTPAATPANASGSWESENWSLLDSFPSTAGAGAIGSGAPEFPSELASNSPTTTSAPPVADVGGNRNGPEQDVWILGGSGGSNSSEQDLANVDRAGSDRNAAAANNTTPRSYPDDAFTRPGGLFSDNQVAQAAPAPAASPAAAPELPVWDLTTQPSGLLDDAFSRPTVQPESRVAATPAPAATPAQAPAEDPWLASAAPASQPAAQPASVAPQTDWIEPPAADFSTAHAGSSHTPVAVQQATYTQRSLVDICGPLSPELTTLVTQLDIPESGVRKAVLADLAQQGRKAEAALPAIRLLLQDHPLIAAHAAWTIWEITGDEREVQQALVTQLQTGNPEVVQFAAYALGALGPKALDSAPALRVQRERCNGATRLYIAEALTRIDAFDAVSVEVLIQGLSDSNPHYRWLAALSLGRVQRRHAELAVPALTQALRDSDPEVRSAAALSIGGFGAAAQSAVPELESRATLDAPTVREAAQTALACIRKR